VKLIKSLCIIIVCCVFAGMSSRNIYKEDITQERYLVSFDVRGPVVGLDLPEGIKETQGQKIYPELRFVGKATLNGDKLELDFIDDKRATTFTEKESERFKEYFKYALKHGVEVSIWYEKKPDKNQLPNKDGKLEYIYEKWNWTGVVKKADNMFFDLLLMWNNGELQRDAYNFIDKEIGEKYLQKRQGKEIDKELFDNVILFPGEKIYEDNIYHKVLLKENANVENNIISIRVFGFGNKKRYWE